MNDSKAAKEARLRTALSHREADRIPAGEFFWSGFLDKCRATWGPGFDPYRHFDLDYVVINPNMDPRIQPFEIVHEEGEDIVVKTGFGATIRRSGKLPMPHFEKFSVEEAADMAAFGFDDPRDPRRFFSGGDDQINCVGDRLSRNIASWSDRVDLYCGEFPVFGSVCEVYEELWRIIGSVNSFYWVAEYPEEMQAFVDRVGKFLYDLCEAQIEAGKGRLSGMYLWGDVAYKNGMIFGPEMWRALFKPHVKAIIDLCHRHDLMVIYHGCGNASSIYDDFAEIGLDAYNPLEAKAGLDVVELKKQYAGRMSFCGNINVQVLETNDRARIEAEVMYKLNAGRNGGWIFQSDHSVSSDVEPESYAYAIELLRRHGTYPLPPDTRHTM